MSLQQLIISAILNCPLEGFLNSITLKHSGLNPDRNLHVSLILRGGSDGPLPHSTQSTLGSDFVTDSPMLHVIMGQFPIPCEFQWYMLWQRSKENKLVCVCVSGGPADGRAVGAGSATSVFGSRYQWIYWSLGGAEDTASVWNLHNSCATHW